MVSADHILDTERQSRRFRLLAVVVATFTIFTVQREVALLPALLWAFLFFLLHPADGPPPITHRPGIERHRPGLSPPGFVGDRRRPGERHAVLRLLLRRDHPRRGAHSPRTAGRPGRASLCPGRALWLPGQQADAHTDPAGAPAGPHRGGGDRAWGGGLHSAFSTACWMQVHQPSSFGEKPPQPFRSPHQRRTRSATSFSYP